MDILIKNIDIPKNGTLTLVIHPNGEVYLGDVLEDIKIGKAIKLPPHGELIERIIPNYDDFQKNYQEYFNDNMSLNSAHIVIVDIINNAPTILEASI